MSFPEALNYISVPLLSKSGNLSMREILVVTSEYVRTDSGGGGGEYHGDPIVARRMPSFEKEVSLIKLWQNDCSDSFKLKKK